MSAVFAKQTSDIVRTPACYLKPNWAISRVLNPLVMHLGLAPTLAVRGRRSGDWHHVPVNVLTQDGSRYLVATRGETDWARNLRAVGGGRLLLNGVVETLCAAEVADAEKPSLIAAYLARWPESRDEFAALANPTDHPVFRLEHTEA